jgi:hypothetical protein
MELRSPCGHQLLTDTNRKREIREAAAVQVAEFASADAELQEAGTVRGNRHARPGSNLALDCVCDTANRCSQISNLKPNPGTCEPLNP